jgi:hypothetical protein
MCRGCPWVIRVGSPRELIWFGSPSCFGLALLAVWVGSSISFGLDSVVDFVRFT